MQPQKKKKKNKHHHTKKKFSHYCLREKDIL